MSDLVQQLLPPWVIDKVRPVLTKGYFGEVALVVKDGEVTNVHVKASYTRETAVAARDTFRKG